ncbi:MAG: polysaccharide lyase [Planctomycetes bacterium]|nr:polysaccharide lyase [Planctomycetota bacterium]
MKLFLVLSGLAVLMCTTAQAQTMNEREAAIQTFINDNSGRIATVENALNATYAGWNGTTPPPTAPTGRTLIFSTTHETGSLSSWNFGRTAAYNSGNGKTWIAELSNAKSGRYALAQSITADETSGARCFITADKDNKGIPHELYATTYLYLPTNFPWQKVGSWYNIQQYKERQTVGASSFVDPTLIINIGKDSNGAYLYLYNWIVGQRVSYNQSGTKKYLPLGKWIKLEWYVKSSVSGGATWLKQDDVQIISKTGIKTISNDNYVLNWSVDNYAGTGPGATTIYWDDCSLEAPK